MPVKPDELLDELYQGLFIDDEWAVRDAESFTWWPHRIRQMVRAFPPVRDHGEMITRVVAEVPLLTQVRSSHAPELSSLANMVSVGTGVVFDPAERTLRRRLTVSMWDGNRGWLKPLLLQAMALQFGMVTNDAVDLLAASFDAEADYQPHPTSGQRPEADDMTNVTALYTAAGQETVITNGELAELPVLMRQMVRLRADGPSVGARIDGAVTARWSLASTQHPALGWGLLSLLKMSAGLDGELAYRLVTDLNLADSGLDRSAHYLGGWSVAPDDTVAYSSFTPELVYARASRASRLARLQNLVVDGCSRADWASTWIDSWKRRSSAN